MNCIKVFSFVLDNTGIFGECSCILFLKNTVDTKSFTSDGLRQRIYAFIGNASIVILQTISYARGQIMSRGGLSRRHCVLHMKINFLTIIPSTYLLIF